MDALSTLHGSKGSTVCPTWHEQSSVSTNASGLVVQSAAAVTAESTIAPLPELA